MKFTLVFLVINYLLLIIGRVYQFDDSTFLWTHYSTMLPLIWLIAPICIIVFLCRRFRQKWIYIGSTLALHVFMTVWVNYIGDISAKFTFGKPAIYPSQMGHFVVVNPPQGQQVLIDLIMKYFEQHPFDRTEEEYYTNFYRRSVDTPVNGKITLTHWWDQSPTGPDPRYIDTFDYSIASFASFNRDKTGKPRNTLSIWLNGDYGYKCEKNETTIVIIEPNKPQDPTCD
ncbi:hypothetical protein ACLEC2_02575 [Lonsdalea quercina]|uniref:hypothetical protein n=1 Tax=Lonsdalea quercina TaxID=71657 RepID=UPI0039770A5F